MRPWTVGWLADAARGAVVAGTPEQLVAGVSLDSRRIAPGQAFLAICGRRMDAHAFVPEAVANGARCVIVSTVPEPSPDGVAILHVADTTKALGAIAAAHRATRNIPVVAITGSCGKTTTKELIAALAGTRYRPLKTHLNENNHIGLPLTLLRLSLEHDAAIVELGSNHPGEIAYLAGIARPTVAAITNVGPAHLEFFGSLHGVLDEKLSLLSALAPGGTAIVPGDQLEVVLEAKRRVSPGVTLLTFGTSGQCGVQGLDIRRRDGEWTFRVRGVGGLFSIGLAGAHNVENALAALACARALGLPLESLRDALAECEPSPMRSELIRCGEVTLVNDCYNANPLSFARALEALSDLDVARRVVIAGDMRELGDHAAAAHQTIGRLAAEHRIQVIIAVGERAALVASGAGASGAQQCHVFRSVEELLPALSGLVRAGDGVLIKGSRGMQLERAVQWLRDRYESRAELVPGLSNGALA